MNSSQYVIEEAYMRSGNMLIVMKLKIHQIHYQHMFHHCSTGELQLLWMVSLMMTKHTYYSSVKHSIILKWRRTEATPSGGSTLVAYYRNRNERDYYVRIPFNASSHGSKFSYGVPLYTSNGQLNGETVAYTFYSGNNILVHIYLGRYNCYSPHLFIHL